MVRSDYCSIDLASVGTNEGSFTPRNFLNVASWIADNASVSDNTVYKFYGYYPETGSKEATYSSSLGGVLLNVPAAQTGEFGRYQICSSGAVELTKSEILKNKMIRFTFAPLTSLLRLRLYLSEDTDASIREAYIKQVILTASETCPSNLTGACFLKFGEGTLSSTESEVSHKQITVTLPSPVKITRDKESNDCVDFVLLSTAAAAWRLSFDARLTDNTKLTVAAKDAPAEGFIKGTRYVLERPVTIVLSDDSDDASYVDGGDAWENRVDNDGAYTDAGYAW